MQCRYLASYHVHMHSTSKTTNKASAAANAPGTLSRVPNTPNRVLRVEEPLWRAAQAKAAAEGRSLTAVIVAYLRRYVSTPARRKPDDEG